MHSSTLHWKAWKDSLTKERSFFTPLAISAATGNKPVEMTTVGVKRQLPDNEKRSQSENKRMRRPDTKGKGKGKGKGNKTKSEGRQAPNNCARTSPDGKSICYGYNDPVNKCKNQNCSFAHVCGICFLKHPMYACQGKGKFSSPETQGRAEPVQ